MKTKQKKRKQKRPTVSRYYSLFLSRDERKMLERALVARALTGATSKREGKESVIEWAEQARSRAVFLQMVLDGVLKIQVNGQDETNFHFLAQDRKNIRRGKRESFS
jgi:hypothetical protein